jgi:hypothetical protein
MIDLHMAIYALNSSIKTIRGEDAFDENNNPVAYDMSAAQSKLAELQAAEDQKKQAAHDKLAALGLTVDDLRTLIG